MGPREASIKLLMEQDAGKLFFSPLSLALQAVLFYVTMCVPRTLSSPSRPDKDKGWQRARLWRVARQILPSSACAHPPLSMVGDGS